MGLLRKIIDFFVDGEYHIVYRKINIANRAVNKTALAISVLNGENTVKRIKYSQLRPTWHYWYADPILYTDSETTKDYVFMEVYDRFSDKGFIGVSEFDVSGKLLPPKKALEEPFHLSFPFTFHYDGKDYMLPESIAGGGLRLYQKGESITDWRLVHIFEDITDCVDSVVYCFSGNLYFVTTQEKADEKLKTGLRLYKITDWDSFAYEELTDRLYDEEYRYDVRNGGKMFTLGERIYRVTQKSTDKIYGKEIEFNLITEFTDEHFRENKVGSIQLTMLGVSTFPLVTHRVGVHTYGFNEHYEVMDMFVARASLKNAVRKMIKSIKGD